MSQFRRRMVATAMTLVGLGLVEAVKPVAADLVGTSVTGNLDVGFFAEGNLFDPALGYVPPGDSNATGATVNIGSSGATFGFDDGKGLSGSASFTGDQLTITWNDGYGNSNGYLSEIYNSFEMDFVGQFASATLESSTFPPTLTVTLPYPGDVVVDFSSPIGGGAPYIGTAVIALTGGLSSGPSPGTSVPEPSALVLAGISVVLAGGFGWKRRRRSAVSLRTASRQ